MMLKTHLAVGLLVSLFLLSDLKPELPILFMAFFCLGTLFPDIDHPETGIGRRFKIASKTLNFIFSHRGFMHTIFPPLIFFILFAKIGFPHYGFAILVGYFLHLLIDALTYSGVKVFYPILHFHASGFLRTGGVLEYFLFVIVCILVIFKVKVAML